MSLPVLLISLALLALVVLIVSAPLRTGAAESTPRAGDGPAPPAEQRELREELEAEREAKYREIRDAELDFRTGKLSEEDYRSIDGALRSQALEILNRIDAIGPDAPTDSARADDSGEKREESAPARLDS